MKMNECYVMGDDRIHRWLQKWDSQVSSKLKGPAMQHYLVPLSSMQQEMSDTHESVKVKKTKSHGYGAVSVLV